MDELGVYRVMVLDKNTLAINFQIKGVQHRADLLTKHEHENPTTPYELAIVLGADPLSLIAAATSPPKGVSEADLAGSLKGAPCDLIHCEKIDVDVPASSEIVIEGKVPPSDRKLEGPMGEFTVYTSGGKRPLPYLKVKCITYRNNPILTMANMGKPWDDYAVVSSITNSANTKKILSDSKLPVKDVYTWPTDVVVTSVQHSEANLCARIMKTLDDAKCRSALVHTILVGDDVDVTDLTDVLWCFATRLHPKNGIHVETKQEGSLLVPFFTNEERKNHTGHMTYFDCTWPSN